MIRDIKRMQNATAVIFLLIGVELGGWGGYILADSRPRSVAYVDVQQVDRVAGTREIAWEKFLPVMPSLLDVGTGLFGNTTVAPIPDFAADFTVDVCAGPDPLESYVAIITDRPRHRIIYVPCVGPVRTEPE